MKKLLSVLLAAVMIVTLSSSAIFAAPNNNPNAAFNREKSAFENKVKNNLHNEGEENELREQLRFTMLSGEGLPYGLAKRMNLPPGLDRLLLKGTLPHGIAKRLMDNYYPLPGQKTDLEALEALIEDAEEKLVDVDATEYKGATTIGKLVLAIDAAKAFVVDYDETQKSQIKIEIDKLKADMKAFDDAKYLGTTEVNALKVIEERLNDYQEKYAADLSATKQIELENLIVFIQTFTLATDPLLTKGDYDSILMQEKAFMDPLVSLYVKMDEAKTMLYIDIEDPDNGYKVTIGTDPGEYLIAGVVGLHNAIVLAENFVENYTTEDFNTINVEINKLEVAIDAFNDSKVLGANAKATLKMISDQLKDYNEVEEIVALSELIDEIEPFLVVTSELTEGIFNDFMDRSEEYIDDLYAYMVVEIEALIDASETLLGANAPIESDNEIALYTKLIEVKAYVLTDADYSNLVTYYSQLNVLFQALEDELEE